MGIVWVAGGSHYWVFLEFPLTKVAPKFLQGSLNATHLGRVDVYGKFLGNL